MTKPYNAKELRARVDVLLLFTQNEGGVLRAEYLYEKAWKLPRSGDIQAIKSEISRLRKKAQRLRLHHFIFAERRVFVLA